MTIFKPINENEVIGKVKEVFDDIKTTRKIEDVPNFWKYIANDPDTLERTWSSMKQVMRKGALDEMTKELQQRTNRAETFSNDLAHEIRNPLASLKSASELLDKTTEKYEG